MEVTGKVILIINSATECGFTPQYDVLQDLFEKYSDEGFVVLDFPCNQFANQAPGSDEEIVSFCDSTYGITFPIFSKIEVNGSNESPLYTYLKSQKGFAGFDPEHPLTPMLESSLERTDPDYKENSDIKWNFTKFLIDRQGKVVERFEPTTDMLLVEDRIVSLLKQKNAMEYIYKTQNTCSSEIKLNIDGTWMVVHPVSHGVSRVPRYSGTQPVLSLFGYGALTRCGRPSHAVLLSYRPLRWSATPENKSSGLASSAFARHYLRNLG